MAKVINPGGKVIDCSEEDNGYQKAKKGVDGWSLPKDEGGALPPKSKRKGKKDA